RLAHQDDRAPRRRPPALPAANTLFPWAHCWALSNRRASLTGIQPAACAGGESVVLSLLWRVIILKPIIIGHRGAAGLAPENTVLAFRRAYELGVRTLELDVRLTADRMPAVIHDVTVDRTTNGTGRVHELTLPEIQALDAGRRFGVEASVPSLAEALTAVPIDARWLIEMKRDEIPAEEV